MTFTKVDSLTIEVCRALTITPLEKRALQQSTKIPLHPPMLMLAACVWTSDWCQEVHRAHQLVYVFEPNQYFFSHSGREGDHREPEDVTDQPK